MIKIVWLPAELFGGSKGNDDAFGLGGPVTLGRMDPSLNIWKTEVETYEL